MSAKNFQEYLASTGRANSGLSSQARMQNANNLNTSINNLNLGEASALADINRRTSLANDAYNTGLASANATIEANYIKNLLDERNKELQRQFQERQLNEQIRQFNENLALQKQQLYSRFNSGSGGGGGYTRTSNNNNKQTKQTTYSDTGKWVTVNNIAGTKRGGTMKVFKGSDGNQYYRYNNQYIKI